MARAFDIRFEQRSVLNMRHVTHTLHVPFCSAATFCSSTFFADSMQVLVVVLVLVLLLWGSSAFRFDLLLCDTRSAIANSIVPSKFPTPLWADQRHASSLDVGMDCDVGVSSGG